MLEHKGIITKIENRTATINIEVESACASCHAKGMCTSLDKGTKQIFAQIDNDEFEVGETVNVTIKESTGIKAVLLAYFVPFIVLTTTLVIVLHFSQSEALAGILSIAILLPYYFVLYLLRKKINKKFVIYLKKYYIYKNFL